MSVQKSQSTWKKGIYNGCKTSEAWRIKRTILKWAFQKPEYVCIISSWICCPKLDLKVIWSSMIENNHKLNLHWSFPQQLTGNLYILCKTVYGSTAVFKSHMRMHFSKDSYLACHIYSNACNDELNLRSHMHFHIIYMHLYAYESTHSEIVIVIGNGQCNPSLNPGQGCLYFT